MNRLSVASIFLLALFFMHAAWPEQSFVIENIRIEGLQRISEGTVLNYLPVKVGDRFEQRDSADVIKSLFKTGFFKDVRVARVGDDLVVSVEERPTIASVKLEGNKDLSTEEMTKNLKKIGLTEGQVLDRQKLDKVEQELHQAYYNRGKYGVKIETEVKDISRNRVAITLKISEGKVAKIKQINIVGNQAFSDDDLLKDFELGTTNLLSFYTKNDQYSKQKLNADLERLRSYYQDRGYINFETQSTQVSITPDKKEIYITINVKEGEVFNVNEVKLTGKTIVPPEQLTPLVGIGPGDTFSRKLVTETQKAISDRLGDEGYIFANVNTIPDINAANKSVNLTFYVDPGKQVYVRRINIQGNTKTRDEVLRREMRQMEAAWASTTKIERSKTRLERLGYFQDVNVETPAVPGSADQIDVNYTVTEKQSGNMMAGVGYSQVQGIIFNASVTQDNIFGSGKRVSFNFNNSLYSTIYNLGYSNPYATLDGVSSGWNLNYRKTNAYQMNLANYSSDVFSGGLSWGFPLSEYSGFRLNLDYQNYKLNTSQNTGYCTNNTSVTVTDPLVCASSGSTYVPVTYASSVQINQFVNQYGNKYNIYTGALSFVHDTLNRAIFANQGGSQSFNLLGSVPFSDLTFYKASINAVQYFPIAKDLTLMMKGEVAYGNGYSSTKELPFFENYFAGGPQSVRGFMANTLGPRDTPPPGSGLSPRPFGGSKKLVGSMELLFPVPFMADSKSVRLGAFFDAGNVFSSTYNLGDLRYSAGLSARWLSPFGAISFSIAQPLNAQTQVTPTNQYPDQVQRFQFTFGQGF